MAGVLAFKVNPPTEVLEKLLQAAGLARLQDGFLIANPEAVHGPESGSIEEVLVHILRNTAPAITGSEFEELGVSAGLNPTSFYLYRSGSPLVRNLLLESTVWLGPPFLPAWSRNCPLKSGLREGTPTTVGTQGADFGVPSV